MHFKCSIEFIVYGIEFIIIKYVSQNKCTTINMTKIIKSF